eukprot:jgi/Tetstr1/451723/TSEL_038759.t1
MQSTEETAKSFDVVKAIEIQRHDGNGDRVVIVGAVENLKFAVAAFGHPMRAREMSVMNEAAALGVEIGIEIEEDSHRLAPVGPVALGIEQPHENDSGCFECAAHLIAR